MKKTLLAAALAVGFAGVAQAETSVTLYGIIDTGIAYERQNGVVSGVNPDGSLDHVKRTRTGVYDGTNLGQAGSRWGLRGVEDLGNGLRAVFQLESGFLVTTGQSAQGGRLFGRQATVGLHGDAWGQVDLGRQTTVGSKYMLGTIDPFGGGFGQASAGKAMTATDTIRYDNTIIYQTPNFSGFQAGVGYAFNTDGGQAWKYSGDDNPNTRAITAAIRYANGPLGVVLTYDQAKRSSNTGYADTTRSQWNIGAAYDFEVVKVSLGFGQTRNGDWAARNIWTTSGDVGLINAFDKGFKSNGYVVGLSAPVGGGKILASWHMVDPRSKSDAIKDFQDLTGEKVDLKKQQTYNLGYKYPMSKRTDVYAYGSYAKNVHFVKEQKSTVVGIGLTHRF
ncbi:MAG: porin [Castellaniella sp.]